MISSIRLHNFKAFKEETLDFAPLTLLSGMNGLGKSTVLQALLLLRQSHRMNVFPSSGVSLKGEYLELGKGQDILNIFAQDERIAIDLNWDSGDFLNSSFGYEAESDTLPHRNIETNLVEGYEGLKKFSLFSRQFQYLSADRESPKSFFPASFSAVEKDGSLGKRGEFTAHFLARYQRESVAIKNLILSNAPSSTLLDQVSAWLALISPGVSVSSRHYPDLDVASIGYSYDTNDDRTREFSPVNVGFGLTYVLPVIVAILAAKKGDLILVENPESHLHPHGQAVLGKLFALGAAGGLQIIVESHSDHFLNGACISVKNKILKPEDLAIYYFQRDIENSEHFSTVVRPVVDENGRIDRYPSGFFDEYEKQLDELLS